VAKVIRRPGARRWLGLGRIGDCHAALAYLPGRILSRDGVRAAPPEERQAAQAGLETD
jgi:hypothetical protein